MREKYGDKIFNSPDKISNSDRPHFHHHCQKQKKTAIFSIAGSGILIIAVAITSLIVSFIFPKIWNASATTFTFLQTSWAGGADTTATSTHTSNRTGWTKYYAASSTISASSTIQLIPITGFSFTDSGAPTSTGIATGGRFASGTFSSTVAQGGWSTMADIKLATSSQSAVNSWSTLANPPDTLGSMRNGMIRNRADDYIYILRPAVGNFYRYSISGNSWTTLTSAPGGSGEGGAMVRNGSDNDIYVLQAAQSDGFYRYSISGNSWTTLTAVPEAGYNGGGMIRNGSEDAIYVMPGQASTGFYRYSISGNSWTTLTQIPGPVYSGGIIMRKDSDDYIYILRGWGGTEFYRYSISGNSWTTLTAAPAAVNDGSAMIRNDLDNDVYVLAGGVTGFYRYSISGNSWTTLTAAPVAPTRGSRLVRHGADDNIYFIPANDSTGFYRYSISSNSWTTLTAMPGAVNFGGDMIRNGSDNNIYVKAGSNSQNFYRYTINSDTYAASGNFISATISGGIGYQLLSWASSTPSGAGANALQFQVAANNDNSTWNYVGSDGTANTYFTTSSTTIPAGVSGQYFRYKAYFQTTSSTLTPTLYDVTINYSQYPATSSLISSPFDSEQTSNIVSNLTWAETLPSGTDVKLQLRTSADGATWSNWLGPTGIGDYYSTSTASAINSTHSDGSNDRYVQYRVFLISDGANTPTLSGVTLTYIVNGAPEFEVAPTSTQRTSDGYVEGGYSIRDTDTAASGVACPLCVDNLVFAYSTNGGSSYTNITSGLSTNATSSKTVGTSSYTNYQFTWNPKNQLDDVVTSTMIRITIDDKEGANNTASSSTVAFTLDTKDPALGSIPIRVMATSTPALLQLNASDDSALQMCITLDNTLSNCATYNSTSTITLATNPDVVYVRFRDAYQNTTASQSATTPETPTLILLKDVSNISTGDYREFVAWKVVSTPFNNYKVLRSSDGGSNYSVITKISDRLTNYYTDVGLTASSTYYYMMATEDSDGNVSYNSSALNDRADGQGGTDITAPTISNVSVSTSSPQSAIIVWDTDELSNSTVGYSSSPGSFSTSISVATMKDTSSSAGQHSVGLTDLTPNTTYYYQVQSADPSGNTATSSTSPNGFSFTTPAGPVLTNVTERYINNTGATIIWNTDTAANSLVTYSTSSALAYTLEAGSDTESLTSHVVNLTGLTASTTYYYYAKSGIGRNDNGGAYYTFITSNDTTAPTLSGINISLKIDTRAVANWTTNEDANTKVELGTTSGAYTISTSTLSSYTTDHTIKITNLSANTTYYYIVVSGDKNGNYTTSSENSFKTLETLSTESQVQAREAAVTVGSRIISTPTDTAPPGIADVRVSDIQQTLATINWRTDEESKGFVEYGDNPIYGNVWAPSFKDTMNHSILLTGLKPDVKYWYRASAIDKSGNLNQSKPDTFVTLKKPGEVIKEEVKKIEEKPTEVKPGEPVKTQAEKEKDELLEAAKTAFNTLRELSSRVSLSVAEPLLEGEFKTWRQSIPAPILSGEPKVLVTDTTGLITWVTDKPANSLVAFAKEGEYKPEQGDKAYSQTSGNSEEFVNEHSVALIGLEPDTIYHFQVISKSLVSGLAKSQDFIFKTKTKELEITNYIVENITSEKAIFRWVTSAETNSSLKYTPYRSGVLAVEESAVKKDEAMTTLHQVAVDNFESGVIYEIELSGRDISGKMVSRKISAFTTSEDDLPPLIYQVQTDSALSPGKDSRVQTVISWLTNEPAVGMLYYKRGAGEFDEETWEQTSMETSYGKRHVAVITKFDPGSIYRFRIKSMDSGGNGSLSQIFTLLTPRQKETVFQIILGNIERTFNWTKRLGL